MMKFLRKYTKHMLVFVTIGILVSWLLGSTLPAMLAPNPGVVTVGRAFGEEVKRRDLDYAALRADTLRRMRLPWQKPWIPDSRQPLLDRTPPLDVLHWMLLVEEAKRSGVLITDQQLARFKAAFGISAPLLARIQKERYLALSDIDQMVREFLLVRQYAAQNLGSIKVSTPEVRRLVRDTQERVRPSAVIIPASQLLDANEVIPEDEIRAAFESYKDVLPGESESGFGYKWPTRLRVEYLELRVEEVESAIAVTDREARDYWTLNKERFLKPVEPPTTQQAQAPTTREFEPPPLLKRPPPAPKAPVPYERFSEAKEAVAAELKKKKARDRAEEVLGNFLSYELRADWDFDNRSQDRYPVAPEVVKQEGYYRMMLDRYANREPRIAPLIKIRLAELSTVQQLGELPGIGSSSFSLGSGERHGFVSLLESVQGLGEMPETGGSELRSLYLALYQSTDRVLKDAQGNCYGFRVVGLVEPSVPASLGEVRERVVNDLRLDRAYRRAEQLAKSLAEEARRTSLEEALEADPERKEKLGPYARIQPGGPTPRMWGPGIAGSILGYRDEALIEAVFQLAAQATPDHPTPVAALAAPSQKAWLVIRVEELKPVTEDAYEKGRDAMRSRLLQGRLAAARADWFDAKRIEQRAGWSAVRQDDS